MIQINLLPEEFRIKPQDPQQGKYLKIAAVVGVLFAILSVYFYIDYLGVSKTLDKAEAKWKQVQPQSQELNNLKSEVEGTLKPERLFLQQFVTTQKPITHLMNWASELLPDGAWLEEMSLDHDKGMVDFLLKGACLSSKTKTSIELIEVYLQNLKQKMPDAKLTLKTSRMTIGKAELTQFTASFSWSETSTGAAT